MDDKHDDEGISRRAFALGGVAIGLAGAVGARQTARLTVREPRSGAAAAAAAATQAGTKAAVGATVSAGNPGGTTRIQAAEIFDQNMGGRKTAMAVERAYWPANTWDLTPAQALIDNNVAIVASYTPSQQLTQAELDNLNGALDLLKGATPTAIVDSITLTHEPNDGKFPSAEAYQEYIDFYGPAVLQHGYELSYIPMVLSTAANDIAAYYPTGTYNGQPMVTRMYGDYYCYQAYLTNNVRLDGFFNVAGMHNTPRVGIGEFGRTTNVNEIPTPEEFDDFTTYLTKQWTAWNAAGHDSAVIMYWTNGPGNNPDPPNYTSLINLWNALSIDNT